ncbi:MAG: thiol oxidoreductase, partial [Actinobacteria bacterium]|nr:thiol oxidoreductase [Actinomycetota bacterium]NIS33207.1 thiol oxidoreductase [Actinomycetota bacterium]NIT96724.1 thiol oxidoreductase [Actinomycetota bacterium]NIU18351.1 thiol oxidoreductase [Actinomycetota bacterium]NIU68122.1 thiol oxidoreductase [Actinomycetota bacterium]
AFTGEIADEDLFRITVYARALAVPAVRDLDDPQVQRGWELFHEVGCASCHTGGFTTGQGPIQGL